MFETLYRILLFTVLVIAIFFVVSTLSFSGRLAEGMSYLNPDYAKQTSSRLFRKIVETAVVVARWMAGSTVFRGILCHLILMATVCQQQKICFLVFHK